jgi:isopenicillin N synthase-like dioxygenase
MSDFEQRRDEITAKLIEAAENDGFFTLVDHGISKSEIEAQFSISKTFFDLPAEIKSKTAHDPITNSGWEYKVSS